MESRKQTFEKPCNQGHGCVTNGHVQGMLNSSACYDLEYLRWKGLASLFKRLQRLQWKLTLSYLVTGVVVLLLFELLIVLIGLFATANQDRATLESQARQLSRIAQPSVRTVTFSDDTQLQALWQLVKDNNSALRGSIVTTDVQARVLNAAGDPHPAIGSDLHTTLPAIVQTALNIALSPTSLSTNTQAQSFFVDDTAYVVAPCMDQRGARGALVVTLSYQRFSFTRLADALVFFGISALLFTMGVGIVGLAFGFITARGLIGRLKRIALAVAAWSQGHFALSIQDSSRDELGQLARQLNQMAEQLQQLLRARQDLATLEERNRLARDLHDSVKQQVFAASFQVSTARALLRLDQEVASVHISEAEGLLRQTQRELTLFIRELRPLALEGRQLVDALRDYITSWQKQTGITADLEATIDALPDMLEEALFRIVQEALANVARHSQASTVTVRLTGHDVVLLTITDNGRGFAVEEARQQGIGLSSMRERVQALHGEITIQSQPGAGTAICVTCPAILSKNMQRQDLASKRGAL